MADRKSLEILEASILKLANGVKRETRKNQPQKVQKTTKAPANEVKRETRKNQPQKMQKTTKAPTTPSIRKRKTPSKLKKSPKQAHTLDHWLTKRSTNDPKPSNSRSKSPERQPTAKKKKTGKPLEQTNSFENYGVILPSYEDIIAEKEQYEKMKKLVARFDAIDHSVFEKKFSIDLPELTQTEFYNCHHVSSDTIKSCFLKFKARLRGIIDGQIQSNRHDKFYRHHLQSSKDIMCSKSAFAFTHDQTELIVDLLREEFDPDDKNTKYLFQVLLPEICLLIFMEDYGVDSVRAEELLDKNLMASSARLTL